ncbi:MAG: Hsp20 family protein, partial [Pyramidobacter sp.]|nr:Hsp20 family protein [Pyramidobacter sp.]
MTLVPSVFGENLFDVFDSDFDRMFSNAFMRNPVMGKRAGHVMKTDVRETENTYELDVDVPGFKKDEVNVQLEKGYLTISAGKKL